MPLETFTWVRCSVTFHIPIAQQIIWPTEVKAANKKTFYGNKLTCLFMLNREGSKYIYMYKYMYIYIYIHVYMYTYTFLCIQ